MLLLGFFKKLVIADNLFPYVIQVTAHVPTASGSELYFLFFAAPVYLFADFSGYSDIARGVSRLFGFQPALNFRAPLLARNPTDFWNRWHISLSAWLRDYVFKPLLRLKCLPGRAYGALCGAATIFLCGVWHGAASNFLIFGLLHALTFTVYSVLRLRRSRAFYLFLSLTSVVFILPSAGDYGWFLRGLLTSPIDGITRSVELGLLTLVIFVLPLVLLEVRLYRRAEAEYYDCFSDSQRCLVALSLWLSILLSGSPEPHAFTYFKF